MEFVHLLPCKPLQDVLEALNALQQRYNQFKSNEKELESLLHIYPSLQEHISSVEKRCRLHRLRFSSDSEHLFRSYTDKLRSTFVSDFKEISRLSQSGRKWKNRMQRFFRAEDISEKLSSLTDNAKEAKQLILELSTLLANAEVLEAHSHEIREHVSAEGQKQLREFKQHLIGHINKADNEEFLPASCGEAVSANPTNLAFDFTSVDEKGEPNTFEGRLKALVLNTNCNSDSRITGVVGGGGTGKSCAVRELARDVDILGLFNGGVYEMKLGRDSSTKAVIEELCKVVKYSGGKRLARELQKEKEVEDVISGASSWFRQHACLFIVDDVWDTSDISTGMITQLSRLAGNRGSRIIFTSRNLNLAYRAAHNTVEFHAREPLSLQARAMLMSTAKMDQNDPRCATAGDSITKILNLCGGLPIALAIAGRFASVISRTHTDPWRKLNSRLTSRVTPLLHEMSDAYGTLGKMIEEATSFLESERNKSTPFEATMPYGDMIQSLSVLQKQEFAPLSMLRRLWKLKDEDDVRLVMESFRDVGIVKDETRRFGDTEVEGLTIHDLVNDYCAAKARRAHMKEVYHRNLLDGYINVTDISIEEFMNKHGSRSATRRWWILANTCDRHFCDHVVRHLVEGNLLEEATELIFEPRWTIAVLKTSERLQLEVDHERLLKAIAVQKTAKKKIEALKLFRSAARLSTGFVADNPYEVWFQLYGRLVGWSSTSPEVREYVRRIEESAERPWLKSDAGCLTSAGGQQAEVMHHVPGINHVYLTSGGNIVACGITRSESNSEKAWVSKRARLDRRPLVTELALGETSVNSMLNEKPSTVLDSSRTFPVCACISPSGNPSVLVIGYDDGKLQLWDIETKRQIGQDLQGHEDKVNCIALSSESRSGDGTVRMWNLRNKQLLGDTIQSKRSVVTCTTISHDESIAVSGSVSATIKVWDVMSGKQLGETLRGHNKGVKCVSISKDNRIVLSGSADSSIRLWSVSSGEQIGDAFLGHEKGVTCLAISDDGMRVVSGSRDKSIRVWNVETGKQEGNTFKGHQKGVTCVCLSSCGNLVASGSRDQTVRIWDVEKGLQICETWEFGDIPRVVCFRSHLDQKHLKLVHASSQTFEIEERAFDYVRDVEMSRETRNHLSSSQSGSSNSEGCLMVSEDGLSITLGKRGVCLGSLERSIENNQWVYSSKHKTLLVFAPQAQRFRLVQG
ncbi:WD40-repeat containing protein [Gracilaria domingensis]|nr:WD40-repeat containing protein [Gracilaria domingensis]